LSDKVHWLSKSYDLLIDRSQVFKKNYYLKLHHPSVKEYECVKIDVEVFKSHEGVNISSTSNEQSNATANSSLNEITKEIDEEAGDTKLDEEAFA
jgi:hypothetical protein